jgi:hypothetical protein
LDGKLFNVRKNAKQVPSPAHLVPRNSGPGYLEMEGIDTLNDLDYLMNQKWLQKGTKSYSWISIDQKKLEIVGKALKYTTWYPCVDVCAFLREKKSQKVISFYCAQHAEEMSKCALFFPQEGESETNKWKEILFFNDDLLRPEEWEKIDLQNSSTSSPVSLTDLRDVTCFEVEEK